MFKLRNILLLAAAFMMMMALSTPLVASSDTEIIVDAPEAPLAQGSGAPNAAIEGLGFTPSGSAVEGTITTASSTYDPTTLSKFIPGSAFVGNAQFGDIVAPLNNSACVVPGAASTGSVVDAYAGVELPNGALLTGVSFYGKDAYAPATMKFRVLRGTVSFPPFGGGSTGLVDTSIVTGNTGALPGNGIGGIFLDVNPDLATGQTGSFLFGTKQNFFGLFWQSSIAAGANHKLCGARVFYKVPTTGDNQVFTPLAPCAIFDSRPGQGGTGAFSANESRNITVTGDTSAIGGDGDCGINSAATAVQVNILILSPAGTGTFKAWQQGGSETAGLVAFTNEVSRWNGSSTIPIAGNDQMTLKMQNSASDIRLVVTGYYSAVSNMGN